MSQATPAQQVEMIPISRVVVINPRVRNRRVFNEIVESIALVGLKRPITVTRRVEGEEIYYDLVCGQGRLEACRTLGFGEIAALIVSADEEDCLVSSLVENCARRQHRALDLLHDIGEMKKRGYAIAEVARKTGLSYEYVWGVTRLLENGEERLLRAVESGAIPITIAVQIADADDSEVQGALQSAYEENLLRGRNLIAARRLVETRKRRGKGLRNDGRQRKPVSALALVRAYEEDTQRKRALIRRSEVAKARLSFVTEAVRSLVDDEAFFAILEQEDLASVPARLAARIPELVGEPG
ncbi:plasmid partitioning protein RepB C-terminal domain-containing protein [Sphingosinicella sp. YJ22]|uniref:plasmid partitioning protein RepB C-terminal domain-containing protein n=1 Tax=Sphingosinicella sp. YJ22 TaxID=1104780 RepID=UPI001FAEAE16|nr:plasmid partitioning protein RepB C-terminal domain-containing protein [Sphingosinicella sp. YJ22]